MPTPRHIKFTPLAGQYDYRLLVREQASGQSPVDLFDQVIQDPQAPVDQVVNFNPPANGSVTAFSTVFVRSRQRTDGKFVLNGELVDGPFFNAPSEPVLAEDPPPAQAPTDLRIELT